MYTGSILVASCESHIPVIAKQCRVFEDLYSSKMGMLSYTYAGSTLESWGKLLPDTGYVHNTSEIKFVNSDIIFQNKWLPKEANPVEICCIHKL